MQIAPPIHPFENMDKISADIVRIQMGIIFTRTNKEILCQRARAKTEQRIGKRENLLRLTLSVGHIAFRTNGNQQRVNARRIHSINRLETGNLNRNHRPGNLVDKQTKCRIFLRGTTHNSKGINSVSPVPNIFDVEHGKIMRQAIIPQMIAKRTLGFGLAGMNHTSNNKIGFRRNNTGIPARIAKPTPGQTPGKNELGQTLGQRHNSRKRMRGRSPDKNTHAQRLSPPERIGMVNPNIAADLVVQTNFFVLYVLITRKLDAIHAQIRIHNTRPVGVLSINLGQKNKWTAIVGPALNLRKLINSRTLFEHRARAHLFGQRIKCDTRNPHSAPGRAKKRNRIGFGFDKALYPSQS